MSYGVSAALQAAVYQALLGDATLAGLVGSAIYDALPSGTLPPLYVSLGPEVARDKSDKSGHGAEHEFTISVVTEKVQSQSKSPKSRHSLGLARLHRLPLAPNPLHIQYKFERLD